MPLTSIWSNTSDNTSMEAVSAIPVLSLKKYGLATISRPADQDETDDMISQQVPLGTPFTAASTTTDILDGIDLTGKNVIVTGGHGRLGREVTRALSAAGATVTVAARDAEAAAAVVGGIDGVLVEQLDLTDPASIDAFAARWLDSGRPLHILVNNAAVLSGPLRRDSRGHELSFSTAHLGHFQLTRALLPALRAAHGARVVNVTSGAARFGSMHWDDVDFTTGFDPRAVYGQSKRANVLFTVELDRRYAEEGIRSFATHPGVIIGPGPHSPDRVDSYRAQGLVDEDGNTIIDPAGGKKTVEQGAATLVFAATSPLLDGIGGVYLKDNDVSVIDDEDRPLNAESIPSEANSAMLSPEDARRLWELSERLTA
jgi:NAD(P)-dependent dehydrogenase (short-subunit alcohol dehydrogenase family)